MLLETYGLTIQQVIGALQSNSVDLTAGSLSSGDGIVTVRAFHGYANLETIRNLAVGFARPEGGPAASRTTDSTATPIRLSDVADVRVATPEASTVSRTNGQPSVGLNVLKTPEGNTIEITHRVDEVLLELAG